MSIIPDVQQSSLLRCIWVTWPTLNIIGDLLIIHNEMVEVFLSDLNQKFELKKYSDINKTLYS